MRFSNDIGILYDAICFGYAYFNEGDRTGGISADAYREVLAAVEELPGWMRPFFTTDVETMTVLPPEVAYGAAASIDSLLEFLSDETDVLDCLGKYYFPNVKRRGADLGQWYRVIDAAELPGKTKMDLLYLFAEYATLQCEVRKAFYRLYRAVKNFRDKQEGTVWNVADKFLERGDFGPLMDEQTAENTVFGVSLMRPDVLALLQNGATPVIVCGPEANVVAPAPMQEPDPAVPLVEFTVACGTEAKMKLLNLLLEHGPLTSAQLARMMGISQPMSWRYVVSFEKANVILCDRSEGRKEIYCRLNPDYFRGVRRSLDELINRLEDE